MPKVKETQNQIAVHVGDVWEKYEKRPEQFEFRTHDIGKKNFTLRVAVKYRDKWQTYAYSFTKGQIKLIGRTLICKDKNAYDILSKMKEEGDLKGYKVVRR